MRRTRIKLVILAIVIVVIPSVSFSQLRYIAAHTNITEGKATPQLNIWLQGNFGNSNSLGWYVWSLVGQDWSETYIGPTYSPTSWSQIGTAIGIETADNPTRYGLYSWLGIGNASVIGFYEDGGSGKWHQVVAGYKILSWCKVSLMKQSFLGFGPRTDFSVRQLNFYTALLREEGINTIVLETRFNF